MASFSEDVNVIAILDFEEHEVRETTNESKFGDGNDMGRNDESERSYDGFDGDYSYELNEGCTEGSGRRENDNDILKRPWGRIFHAGEEEREDDSCWITCWPAFPKGFPVFLAFVFPIFIEYF